LQLNKFFLDEVTVVAQGDFNYDMGELSVSLEIEPSFRFREHEDRGLHLVILQVAFGAEDTSRCPYIGRVKGTGIFTVADGTDEDEAEQLVVFNGTSMVFGMLRGVVEQITAQGRFGAMLLPTVNFVEFFENLEAEHEAQNKNSVP
jgi:preprotein translocase subunit SecB